MVVNYYNAGNLFKPIGTDTNYINLADEPN